MANRNKQDPALSFSHHSAGAKYEACRSRLLRRWGFADKAEECAALQRYHERGAREAREAIMRARA
jgi:hypothetical protein